MSFTRFSNLMAQARGRQLLLVGGVIALFYLFTAAGNRSETDDVYAFAYRAEHFDWTHISDPRLMLYHMLMRGLYVLAQMLGLPANGLTIMSGVSLICAAILLILLVRVLVRHYRVTPAAACVTAALLGLTYGFWRYAAEGDVYISAMLLNLWIWHGILQTGGEPGWSKPALWGGAAGLAILYYQANAIPLILAFPWSWLLQRQLLPAFGYGLAAAAVVILGYFVGFYLYWPLPFSWEEFQQFLAQRSQEFVVPTLTLGVFAKSIAQGGFALGHDLLSANWVFGIDALYLFIQKAFPYHDVMEERFLAEQMGLLRWLSPLTCLAALATGVLLLGQAVSRWRLVDAFTRARAPGLLAIWLWVLINSAIIGRLNPAGIEAWISVLPPLAILFAVYVAQPLLACGQGRLLALTLVLFAAHNSIGGMLWVQSDRYEYEKLRGQWIITNATEQDLVIVTQQADLAEALRYLSPADVAMMRSRDAPRLATLILAPERHSPVPMAVTTYGRDFGDRNLGEAVRNTLDRGGRIFLFQEFFTQRPIAGGSLASMLASDNEGSEQLARLHNQMTWVFEDPTGSRTGYFQQQADPHE